METDLLSKEVTKMLPLKKLRVSKVYEPTGLSQASNAILIVEKSKSKFGFQGKSRILRNPFFTFSISECLVTER